MNDHCGNGGTTGLRGELFGDVGRKEWSEESLRRLVHIEEHPNGGASVVHVYQDELDRLLPREQTKDLAEIFFREVFRESSSGVADHVMGVVHGTVGYLPEMVQYLSTMHPDLSVKAGHLRKSEVESMRMEEYAANVASTYCQGTFRTGPLQQVSLVGQVAEESGGFLSDVLDLLEENPFLAMALPWGSLSALDLKSRSHSDDGPILWVRPGEQLVPTADHSRQGTPRKKRMLVSSSASLSTCV
jgi:hypothetical protein